MKIACCISGFPTNKITNYVDMLQRYSAHFDFFIFLWDVINEPNKLYINDNLHPKELLFLPQMTFDFDAKYKEPDKPDRKSNALSMFYGIDIVQKMRQGYEMRNKMTYDLVIRFRYDNYILDDLQPVIKNITKLLLAHPEDSIVSPWEYHHVGICDQLWFGRSSTMNKFTKLFDWIKDNINDLLFINESVLYKFIHAQNIKILCTDIKYVLMRAHLLGFDKNQLMNEYQQQLRLPWVATCPEKREGKYQTYIDIKNVSTSSTYFLTHMNYSDTFVKIINCKTNRFLYADNQNYYTGIKGGNVASVVRVHVYSVYLVNLFVKIMLNGRETEVCLTSNNDRIICTTNIHDLKSQFFLYKTDKTFRIILNLICDNPSGTFGKYLNMSGANITNTGNEEDIASTWMFVKP